MQNSAKTFVGHHMNQACEQSRQTVANGSSVGRDPSIWNDARRNRKGKCGVAARELKLVSGPSMSMLGPVMCLVIQLQCEPMKQTISAEIAKRNCTQGEMVATLDKTIATVIQCPCAIRWKWVSSPHGPLVECTLAATDWPATNRTQRCLPT